MKVLKLISSWVIWSLVALYVLMMSLIYLPPFQEWLGVRVSHAISGKLGTSARVGTVQLIFPNRVIIDDVGILDQQQQDMLRIGRLSVKLQWIPLLTEGRIVISSAQLFGAHANIYKADSDSPTNIQFALDALASSDTTSQPPIDLRINSLIVRHSSVRYDQNNIPTSNRLNTNHLKLSDISTHIILKTLTEDSLNLNVKRLTFNERSGVNITNLTFNLRAGKQSALLSNFTLQLPHSELTVDSLRAHYHSEQLEETLNFHLGTFQADVKLSDLKGLLPELGRHSDVVSLTTTAEGNTQFLNIPKLEMSTTGHGMILNGKGWIYGKKDEYSIWHTDIQNCSISEEAIHSLMNEIKLPQQLANIGDLHLAGVFNGTEDGNIETKSTLSTGVGALIADFTFAPEKKIFAGQVSTKGIDLKRLLKEDELGQLVTTVKINGSAQHVTVTGKADQFDYKGYSYRDIQIDGKLSEKLIQGKIAVNDPNLTTSIEGEWQKTNQLADFYLTGTVDHIKPQALNLSNSWGEATFSGKLDADIHASSLNDAEGTIDLDDFVMNDSTGFFRIDNVHLKTGFNEGKHFLKFNGDIGEGQLIGQFDWQTLSKSVLSCISSRLTTMPGLPKTTDQLNNNFDINLNIISSEWIKRVLNIPLTLDAPIIIKGNLNDATHAINLDCDMPGFYYDEAYYQDATLKLTSTDESIVCQGNMVKHMDNNTKMDLALKADAYNNEVITSFEWNNHAADINEMKGSLNVSTKLYLNERNVPEAHIQPHTSHITLGGTQWEILPCDIIYSDKRLLIDRFAVEHDQQHLIIDGIASESAKDTLSIDMKGIDISYVLDLLNFHPVEFDGEVTGHAYASQLFGKPSANANIEVSQFRFEGGRMGTLFANAEWNEQEEQIDIHALADDGPDARTFITGYVSPVRSDIELNILSEGTYIDFVQNYTNSFLKDITGHAHGEVQLKGPLGAMDLLGKLVVDGQATVIPLGTTYTLKDDTVTFIRDDIQLKRANVYDANGDVAYLSGGFHHQNLSNMTFDLNVETSRFLAYDIKELGSDLFCGSVTVSGKVDLHGRPGEVVINCEATPLKPTVFTYNAATSDAVSKQDFITWHNKQETVQKNAEGQEALAERDIPTDIYINFLINATPDATVKLMMDANTGDYITLYGSGVLRASYHNKGAFQMFGTYTVDRGTYGITIQNIIKKNFVFQEGSTLVFGGNPLDANLQMQAVYTVNGVSLSDLNIGNSFTNNTVRVNCLMNITGQAGAPRVDFDLDMPTVNSEEKQMVRSVITSEQEMNQQVLYLLGIGRFYTQGMNNAETQEYGQTQLAMQSFLSGTLSTQINEVISQVIKNDDWNFGANISTGNEGWHNAEYEGLVSGRMLNNRLLINGQFGYRDNATQTTPSFIGDFDIRYLLIPSGNLALKMYNQTNDRYFTRSSLNTQGIGLIIKKDFDGIGELFQRRKK